MAVTDLSSHPMVLDIDVLGTAMVQGILSQCNCALVVTIDNDGLKTPLGTNLIQQPF